MLSAVVLLSLVSLSCAAVHSLKYFYTSASGISHFPEFIGIGKVDDIEISYYDSTSKQAVPKQDWMALDHNYWRAETQVAKGYEQAFKEDKNILKERLNQTHGVHVFQKMYSCWWDDESGATGGSEQFGYDGEDFMVLDLHSMRWIAVMPQASITTVRWNRMENTLLYRKDYFHNICVDWLKKYLHYGDSSLRRTVPPEVSLLQKGSEVVCHVTGFYPKEVKITWKRDGVEMEDDMHVGVTLPNGDGTFQKRVVLAVSSEERNKHQYTCEVEHKSEKKTIQIFAVQFREGRTPVIKAVAFGVLVGIVLTVVVLRKRRHIMACCRWRNR